MSKEPVTRAAPRNGETQNEGRRDAVARRGDGPEETSNEVDLEGTRGVVDERLEKRSARNEEGYAKTLKEAEELHKNNDGKPDPKLGREDNGNTPVIGKDGSKSWHPPGVAGAPK